MPYRDATAPIRSRLGCMRLRVVFAEDNYLVRQGTAALLATSQTVELVCAVEDPPSLLAAVRELSPDAVLTDIRMPPTYTKEGIDAAKQIRAEHPDVGVVVLSQYVEENYVFDLLQDGVEGLGYLLKERISDTDELVRALHDVARGGSALDPRIVESLMQRTKETGISGELKTSNIRVVDAAEVDRISTTLAAGGEEVRHIGRIVRAEGGDRDTLILGTAKEWRA